jgi:hypothetical protein
MTCVYCNKNCDLSPCIEKRGFKELEKKHEKQQKKRIQEVIRNSIKTHQDEEKRRLEKKKGSNLPRLETIYIDGIRILILMFKDGTWCSNTSVGDKIPKKIEGVYTNGLMCGLIAMFMANQGVMQSRCITSPYDLYKKIKNRRGMLPPPGKMLERWHLSRIAQFMDYNLDVRIKSNPCENKCKCSATMPTLAPIFLEDNHYLVPGLDKFPENVKRYLDGSSELVTKVSFREMRTETRWDCTACTFSNESSKQNCEMCGSKKSLSRSR